MKKLLIGLAGLLMHLPVGATGYWTGAANGYVPTHAYVVGTQPNGAPLYLCKGLYNGRMYIGNLSSAFEGCHITHKGNVIAIPRYTVWIGNTYF